MPYPPFAGSEPVGAVMAKKKSKVSEEVAVTTIPRVGSSEYARYARSPDNNASAIMGSAAVVHDKTKWLDPGYWIVGKKNYQKVQDFLGGTGPTWTNRFLKPISTFHRKYLDPLQWVIPEDSSLQKYPDYAENKSGDVIAAVLGSYFGAQALAGMGGGGTGASAGSSAMSPYGPYAAGYQFPAGSSFAAPTTAGSTFSAYGPYAAGYQFPAASSGSSFSAYGPYATGYQFPAGSAPGGASAGASTPSATSGIDWTNPKTYQRFGSSASNSQQRSRQQPASTLPAMLAQMQMSQQQDDLQAEMDRMQREREEQERKSALARQAALAGLLNQPGTPVLPTAPLNPLVQYMPSVNNRPLTEEELRAIYAPIPRWTRPTEPINPDDWMQRL